MLSRGRFWVVLPHPKASACAWWIPLIHIKRCAFVWWGPIVRYRGVTYESLSHAGKATSGEWLVVLENSTWQGKLGPADQNQARRYASLHLNGPALAVPGRAVLCHRHWISMPLRERSRLVLAACRT